MQRTIHALAGVDDRQEGMRLTIPQLASDPARASTTVEHGHDTHFIVFDLVVEGDREALNQTEMETVTPNMNAPRGFQTSRRAGKLLHEIHSCTGVLLVVEIGHGINIARPPLL